MVKALKQIGGKFSLVVQIHKDSNNNDFEKEMDACNALARKEKPLVLPQSGAIDPGEVFTDGC